MPRMGKVETDGKGRNRCERGGCSNTRRSTKAADSTILTGRKISNMANLFRVQPCCVMGCKPAGRIACPWSKMCNLEPGLFGITRKDEADSWGKSSGTTGRWEVHWTATGRLLNMKSQAGSVPLVRVWVENVGKTIAERCASQEGETRIMHIWQFRYRD